MHGAIIFTPGAHPSVTAISDIDTCDKDSLVKLVLLVWLGWSPNHWLTKGEFIELEDNTK